MPAMKSAGYKLVQNATGEVPSEVLPLGEQDSTGNAFSLAVANTRWGQIPGKAKHGRCWCTYEGTEYHTKDFSYIVAPKENVITVEHSSECTGPPDGAIKVGDLYAAMAVASKGKQKLGKARGHTCWYGHGGREQATQEFSWIVYSTDANNNLGQTEEAAVTEKVEAANELVDAEAKLNIGWEGIKDDAEKLLEKKETEEDVIIETTVEEEVTEKREQDVEAVKPAELDTSSHSSSEEEKEAEKEKERESLGLSWEGIKEDAQKLLEERESEQVITEEVVEEEVKEKINKQQESERPAEADISAHSSSDEEKEMRKEEVVHVEETVQVTSRKEREDDANLEEGYVIVADEDQDVAGNTQQTVETREVVVEEYTRQEYTEVSAGNNIMDETDSAPPKTILNEEDENTTSHQENGMDDKVEEHADFIDGDMKMGISWEGIKDEAKKYLEDKEHEEEVMLQEDNTGAMDETDNVPLEVVKDEAVILLEQKEQEQETRELAVAAGTVMGDGDMEEDMEAQEEEEEAREITHALETTSTPDQDMEVDAKPQDNDVEDKDADKDKTDKKDNTSSSSSSSSSDSDSDAEKPK